MEKNCLFCKIIRNEIPAQKVFENDSMVIIKDISPQAPYHYLGIPKEHYPGIHDIPEGKTDILEKLFSSISEFVKKEGLVEKGYRLVVNSGEKAGQSVDHIHVHILSGRAMGWPPG
ncbi:MAG TPA: histidine triad nucleotide-binding protein [Chitinispirillaceae bacterium]|jgi:histidine triad (HIT) family protein|nr:histidine triad nucleotide-binding protein [Chitinispirillaceae bacterium]